MEIILKFAEVIETKNIQDFFLKYLKEDNPWIVNGEFLCPFGIEWAIKRKQIIILKYKNDILWALRFYFRKRDGIVSLYQFALNEDIIWKWLIKKMLQKTWYNKFESICFKDSYFNNYYLKSWWKFDRSDTKFNYWIMEV